MSEAIYANLLADTVMLARIADRHPEYAHSLRTVQRDIGAALETWQLMQQAPPHAELEHPDDYRRIAAAVEYLQSIGEGNAADAIIRMAQREDAQRATWEHCDCGARRRPGALCPTCDEDADSPCICREYPPAILAAEGGAQ